MNPEWTPDVEIIHQLLDIAKLAMPITYWLTDSRVQAAKNYLEKKGYCYDDPHS